MLKKLCNELKFVPIPRLSPWRGAKPMRILHNPRRLRYKRTQSSRILFVRERCMFGLTILYIWWELRTKTSVEIVATYVPLYWISK